MNRALRRLLPLALVPFGALAGVPLELPPRMHLQGCADGAQVSAAILTALDEGNWVAHADSGDSIAADLTNRMHALRIRIDYNAEQITFGYVDSERLGHEEHEGEHFIDAGVNRWLRDLAAEVEQQVPRFCVESEPVEVVPVSPEAP